MKKAIVLIVAALVAASSSMIIYMLWKKPVDSHAQFDLKIEEQQSQEEKNDNKPNPFRHFMPEGWSMVSKKELDLDKIYLPFLHRKFAGQKIRVAHIEGPGLKFTGSKSNYVNTHITRGTIVLLAETNQLLRIVMHGEVSEGPLPGEMSLEKAEEFYKSSEHKYIDLPKDAPKLTFQHILNQLYPGDVPWKDRHKASRIAAVFVVSKSQNYPPKIVWNVHFHDFHGPQSPTDGYIYPFMRYTLNDDGKLLSEGNWP